MNRQRGFSLIEMVMVIVVVSIAGVALLSLYGNAAKSLSINDQVQTAVQLAQDCGEYVLAFRRDTNASRGYANVTLGTGTGICSGLPVLSGYTRSVDVTDASADPACPTGASCKQVQVIVDHGTTERARVALLLAEY